MREVFCKRENCSTGGVLEYSLILSKNKDIDNGEYETYGISITHQCDGSNQNEVIEDISTDFECVKKLFFLLTEAEVYPVSLTEIVYDYLCSETAG